MTRIGDRFESLAPIDLLALHRAASCPEVNDLSGSMAGAVLTGTLALPGVRSLRLWRGKQVTLEAVTTAGGRSVSGLNRLGVGPAEVRRFRFDAYLGPSRFGDRQVLLLDHDHPANPGWVRRFHDEVVQVDDDLLLATTHYRWRSRLRPVCLFALLVDPAARFRASER